MTAQVRPAPRMALNDDARQLIAVLVVVAIALIAGYGLKWNTENQTRSVSAGGVSASIPQTWVYQPGAGTILFTALDPRSPGQRYSVSRIPTGDSATLSQVVDLQVGGKSRVLGDFQVLSRDPVTVGGRTGEAVTYVYVKAPPGQVPQVIEGRDEYLPESGAVLVVSLESPSATFDRALPAFNRFAGTVGG
jgi:hypothetical protein